MSSEAAQTLLLDQSWQPIGRVTLDRAMRLLVKGRAEVVEEHDQVIWTAKNSRVKTATEEFRSPSVMRLIVNIAQRHRGSLKFNRVNVWLRDGGKCQYCGIKLPSEDYTYDHVIPASKGGTRRWENVVVACYPCNQKKGGRTPEQAGMRLLRKPMRPEKLPHMANPTAVYWKKGMPTEWKTYLRDVNYWESELE